MAETKTQDIEIVRWVVRVNENKPSGAQASIVGFDFEGNEYEVLYRDTHTRETIPFDIIRTDKSV